MFDVQAFLRRQTDRRRFILRLGSRAMAGTVIGALGAALTLWVDRKAGLTLPLPASNVQLLLGTLVGAMVTVAVFVLWMRTVVVGLASSQASPRVLTGYLDDAFQRALTAGMMGGFVYLTVVTAALPAHRNGGEGVPAISAVLSLAVMLIALATVLAAMHNARSSLAMPQVVRMLADRAFAVMAAQDSPNDPPPPSADRGGGTVLHAPRMGWIQWVEHEAILRELPPETTLTLDVNITDFVAEGQRLAWADTELDAEAAAAIVKHVTIVPARASEYDLSYAIQQLVDVAEHAMTPSSVDTSTAHEALVHLRAVFRRLLQRGTATGALRGEEGRWVVARSPWGTADHLRAAFPRLVTGGSKAPTIAEDLLAALSALERLAGDLGDTASEDVLSEQRARLQQEAGCLVGIPTGAQR